MWVILEFFIYVKIWLILNGGLLSDVILCGNSCAENIFSSAEMVQSTDVDDTHSTAG